MTPAVLAVDAGQTEIRAALADGERGSRSATAPGVMRMGRRVGPEEVAEALVAALIELRPLPEPLPPLGVGLSGFEAAAEEDLRRVGELLSARLSVERLSIASDGVTSLLGALGERDGAVVAAGTGTVCVARRGERLAKVDGWGSLLGDAGSGFAIGRAGPRPGSAPRRRAWRLRGAAAGCRAPLRTAARAPREHLLRRRAGPGGGGLRCRRRPGGRRGRAARRGRPGRCGARARGHGVRGAGAAVRARRARLRLVRRERVPGGETVAGAVHAPQVPARRPGTEVVPPEGDGLAGAALLAALDDGLRPEPGLLWRATA